MHLSQLGHGPQALVSQAAWALPVTDVLHDTPQGYTDLLSWCLPEEVQIGFRVNLTTALGGDAVLILL